MTNSNKAHIRNAQKEDATLIARCLLAAMEMLPLESQPEGEMAELLNNIAHSSTLDDELYSYRNVRVAEIEGLAVGCLIAYDGSQYKEMREITFNRILEKNGLDLTNNPLETDPGEYYLDCMAILPKYRGKGIGQLLMQDGIERAKGLGIAKVTLLVDSDHPRLQTYYSELGFSPISQIEAFGTTYTKMAVEV